MSVSRWVMGLVVLVSSSVWAAPFATQVISYTPGSNITAGYDDPNAALGAPSTLTGGWPPGTFEPVTPFSPPWMTDQVVSIGAGGELIVGFDQRIYNDPSNPFGIDLIIFGNSGFIDADWPNGFTGPQAMLFDLEPARIAVSQDGSLWYEIIGVYADTMFPTDGMGDPTKPVDPSLTLGDFDNLFLADIRALYDGSAGGTGVDIGVTGLDWIQFVKVWQDPGDTWSSEIDAFSIVGTRAIPEPATLLLMGVGAAAAALRGRRKQS